MGLFNFTPRDRPNRAGSGLQPRPVRPRAENGSHDQRRPSPREQDPDEPERDGNDEEDFGPPRSQTNHARRQEQTRSPREQGRPAERDKGDGQPARPHPKIPGSKAVRLAREHLAELTGQVPESMSGLVPTPEGGWKVTFDIVELERIPQTTDVMASYELTLDERGELVGYRRVSRYCRNHVDEM